MKKEIYRINFTNPQTNKCQVGFGYYISDIEFKFKSIDGVTNCLIDDIKVFEETKKIINVKF